MWCCSRFQSCQRRLGRCGSETDILMNAGNNSFLVVRLCVDATILFRRGIRRGGRPARCAGSRPRSGPARCGRAAVWRVRASRRVIGPPWRSGSGDGGTSRSSRSGSRWVTVPLRWRRRCGAGSRVSSRCVAGCGPGPGVGGGWRRVGPGLVGLGGLWRALRGLERALVAGRRARVGRGCIDRWVLEGRGVAVRIENCVRPGDGCTGLAFDAATDSVFLRSRPNPVW